MTFSSASEVGLKPPEGCLWPQTLLCIVCHPQLSSTPWKGRNRFCINGPGRRNHHTSALGSIPVLKGEFKLHEKLEQAKGMELLNSDTWACFRLAGSASVASCMCETVGQSSRNGHGRQKLDTVTTTV